MRDTGMLSQPLRMTWLPTCLDPRLESLLLDALERGGVGVVTRAIY